MVQLSVIVPVYNVEKYIEKCLNSVIENDLGHSELEIIVVDDESPDQSVALINSTFGNLSFVKIISQKNKGLGGARNTGIANSAGQYLLFLDSDDWLLPNTLKSIVAQALSAQVDVLEFAAQGVDPNGKIVYQYQTTTSGQSFDGVSYYNKVRYMNSACNKLYRRKFLTDNSLYFLERIFIEDFEFNTRVFLKAEKVAATDFLVPQYLQSPNSITRNTDRKKQQKMVSDIFQVLEITQNLFQQSERKGEEISTFFSERLGFVVATLFYQLFKNRASFEEIIKLKTDLVSKNLFYVNHPLHQKSKNLFRIALLKNFGLFRFAQFLRRLA